MKEVSRRLTPEAVALSVGEQWQPTWTQKVPELRPGREALAGMGRLALGVYKAAGPIADLPDGHRAPRLEVLAKTGRTAIEQVDASEARALDHIDRLISGYYAESRRQLAKPSAEVAMNFALSEIRAGIRTSKDPVQSSKELLGDPEALRAVLSVPGRASGLTPSQQLDLFQEAEHKHLPHIFEARGIAEKARAEVVRSAAMARKLIAEAAGLVQTANGWRAAWEIGDEV
jgi:hypothetical protein